MNRWASVLCGQPASTANDYVRDSTAHLDEGVPEDVEQNLRGHDPHIVAFKLALPARNVPQVYTNVPAVLGHPQGCVSSQHIGLLQQGEGRAEMASLHCSWEARPCLLCDVIPVRPSYSKSMGLLQLQQQKSLWAAIKWLFGLLQSRAIGHCGRPAAENQMQACADPVMRGNGVRSQLQHMVWEWRLQHVGATSLACSKHGRG